MIDGVKVLNDKFEFYDLGFPGFKKDSYITEKCDGYYIDRCLVRAHEKFYIHRDMNNRNMITCEDLVKNLKDIISNPESYVIASYDEDDIPLSKEFVDKVKEVLDNIYKGIIVVNNVKIDLSKYEPSGEYCILKSANCTYIHYAVKKYYSIISGQYVLFLADGRVKSYDNIQSMQISKDVRLTREELERIWKS